VIRFLIHFFGWRVLCAYIYFGSLSYLGYLYSIGVISDPFDRPWVQKLMLVVALVIPLLLVVGIISKFISDERDLAEKKKGDPDG
jgi:uncharacterized membrane-anchored protein